MLKPSYQSNEMNPADSPFMESGLTSIVLAGGRSSRLGREKSGEIIAGESLIERIVNRLSYLNTEILFVISDQQMNSCFFPHTKAKTVVDLYPGQGPLGGIHTGLVYSNTLYNLVVACDMPFLNVSLLRYMISLSPGFDIVMPRIDGLNEPLHAVYTKDCLTQLEALLYDSNLKVAHLPELVRTRYVVKDEIVRFDPKQLSFFNINTQPDLDRARALAAQEADQQKWHDQQSWALRIQQDYVQVV